MRFGTLDTFVEFGDWGFRMGRPVANEAFLRALLSYGTYDAYHFYCPDLANSELLKQRIEALLTSPELRRRVHTGAHIDLSSALRELPFDIFHLGDFTYFVPPLARLRNRVAKSPFPITGITHSLDGAQMHGRFLQLTLAGLQPYDGIICTSQCACELVHRKIAETSELFASDLGVNLRCPIGTRVVPLGIDDDLFRPGDRAKARAYLSIPSDAVVALSVGRFSLRTKADWSPIFELLARMKAAGELSHFILIVAGGAARDQEHLLQELVRTTDLADTVALCPNFPPDVKSSLYSAADFYLSIVDNYQETFGLNVAEAMASGLPVIASDFNGYRDAVRPAHNGFLIPTVSSAELPAFMADAHTVLDPSVLRFALSQMLAVDLVELRKALLRLCRDGTLRTSMGERSRALAERYRWPAIIREYEAYWAELRDLMGRTAPVARPGSDLLAGHPTASYLHYAKALLAPTDHVELTHVGRSVLNGATDFIRYDDLARCWSKAIETTLLQLLAKASRPVDELRGACVATGSASIGDVDFHLLWLAKHGAVSVKSHVAVQEVASPQR